jgi:succinate dehydrogenase/fumarate reductase flavoprotein subunit
MKSRFLSRLLVVGSLALATVTAMPALAWSAPASSFERGIAWDGEYDVVVVGFGGAGAATSIAAADAGAKVLLLEKAAKGEEGGNTRYAAQIVLAPKDRAKAITYFKAMRGGYTNQSDKMIEVIVDGAMENRSWLMSLGAKKLVDFPLIEYPELPGADGISTVVIDGELWTAKLWNLLHDNVEARSAKIDVWYSSPATALIQDPATKIIHGVKVAVNGKTLNIRAKNGVVLASGGFENNIDMIQNYAQMPYAYSKGAKYNTGDGIKMAMRVGADLWHMSTLSGPDVNFKAADLPIAFGYGIQNPDKSTFFSGVTSRSVIMVGSDGTRFVNESVFPRHGHINNHGTWISMPIPTPAYMIFDETARLAGPLYPSWSKDSSDEIAKGWIVKADTIAKLAAMIKVPAAALEAQVATYNTSCENKLDPAFGRDPKFLKPLKTGPFYAIELSPSFTNTQGGPRRDVKAEILDVDGNAIPHLYEAGELGSVYADIYNGGGNLSECLFFGRIAGKNAAAPKSDVASDSLFKGASAVSANVDQIPASNPAKGVYYGVGTGMGGKLVVKVTFDGKKIVSVEVVSNHETDGISNKALLEVPKAIVASQNTKVDALSGASVTSKAVMAAVEDALSKR